MNMLYLCFSEKYLNLSRVFLFWKEGGGGDRAKVLKKICPPRAIFNGFDPPWREPGCAVATTQRVLNVLHRFITHYVIGV